MNILILFAHPAFHKSRCNKILVDGISHINNVTFHDLYEEYPELDIDVKREQELLSNHDVVVFHFPLFWYSTPAILKEWQDLVLKHGWAFGSKGDQLKGKIFFCAITAGAPRVAYEEGNFHDHTINQLLSPLRQSAILCKMIPIAPFVASGTHSIETDNLLDFKSDYFKLLQIIADDKLDIDKAKSVEYLNDYLITEKQ